MKNLRVGPRASHWEGHLAHAAVWGRGTTGAKVPASAGPEPGDSAQRRASAGDNATHTQNCACIMNAIFDLVLKPPFFLRSVAYAVPSAASARSGAL